jgi:hypothetical protein
MKHLRLILPLGLATLEAITRITALGYNNKLFPTPHTYWDT